MLVRAQVRQDTLDGHDAVASARIARLHDLGHAADVDSRQKLVLTEVDDALLVQLGWVIPDDPATFRNPKATRLCLLAQPR
jgi:hypothetical protein